MSEKKSEGCAEKKSGGFNTQKFMLDLASGGTAAAASKDRTLSQREKIYFLFGVVARLVVSLMFALFLFHTDRKQKSADTKHAKRRKTDRKRKSAEETETALEANYPSAQLVAEKRAKMEADIRRVAVPPHRYQTLKRQWAKVTAPIVNELKLQIRFNLRTRCVEIRCPDEKAADFCARFSARI